ncbi:MAG: FHA domain-containing protein [Deltaproteobacteria bacterium]|nr:FHA domain-containing protein [Myxococcales bacterium]MDP3217064.1 FHA domain-containing protein [Deltaproteobacteria bacterium]
MSSARTVTLDDAPATEQPHWLLTVVDHPDPTLLGRWIGVPVGEALTLGRDAALASALLEDPGVSRHHARAEARAEALEVTDLGSSNGTWHDAARVSAATLRSGDVLRVGSVTFVARRAERLPPTAAGAGFPDFSEPMARVGAALRDVAGGVVILRGRPFAGVDAVAAALAAQVDRAGALLPLPARRGDDFAPLFARAAERAVLIGPLPLADAVWQDELVGALRAGALRPRLALLWWPDRPDDDELARAALVRSLDARVIELPPLAARREDLPHLVRDLCVRVHGRAPRLHHGLLVALLRARWDDDLRGLERFVRAHLAPPLDGAPLGLTAAMEPSLVAVAAPPVSAAPGPVSAAAVARDARWIRPAGREVVSLEGRHALARVLRVLVDARVERPGRGVEVEEIVGLVWSGQRPVGDSGPHRVHVAISTLRRLGLGDAIARDERGYLLDPRRSEVVQGDG